MDRSQVVSILSFRVMHQVQKEVLLLQNLLLQFQPYHEIGMQSPKYNEFLHILPITKYIFTRLTNGAFA